MKDKLKVIIITVLQRKNSNIVISNIANLVYELPHELPKDLRFKILRN